MEREREWSGVNLNRPVFISSSSHHFYEFHPNPTTTITTCVDQLLFVDQYLHPACSFSSSSSSLETTHQSRVISSAGSLLIPNQLSGMQSPTLAAGAAAGDFPKSKANNNAVVGVQMVGPIIDDYRWSSYNNNNDDNNNNVNPHHPNPTTPGGNVVLPLVGSPLIALASSTYRPPTSTTSAGGSTGPTRRSFKGKNKSPLIKGQWTTQEDM